MSDNFYILLQLDPSINDWGVIEAKITNMQRRWSMQKNQGLPKARRSAERNLKLVGEMKTKLRDATTRKRIGAEAKKELRATKSKQFAHLDSLIQLHKKATINADGLKALVRHAGGGMTEADVIAHLKKRGITVEAKGSAKARPEARSKIDGATAASIRDALKHVGKESLYDFLELNARTSPKILSETADQIYKDLQRVGKTDASTTARQELAGHAKAVFRDADGKKKYDNTFAEEAMEDLRAHIEFAGTDKYLSLGEVSHIVGIARKKGVNAKVATDFIQDIAEKRKWVIQSKETGPTVELRLCGYCNTLARKENDKLCHECGKALVQPCPQCKTPTPTQDECCSGCGCSTGDAPIVDTLLRMGKDALAHGDIKEALSNFECALLIWPGWSEAEACKKAAISKKIAHDSALDALNGLIKKRQLEESQGALDAIIREHGEAGVTRMRQQIDAGIRKAQSYHAEAEKLRKRGKSEEAVAKDAEALEACADFRPAQLALASAPPPSPTDLDVAFVGASARLKWVPVRASGIVTYRVQRKVGGAPTSPNDGATLAETQAPTCQDTEAPSGVPFYYSVYAMRGGVNSRAAAEHGPNIHLVPVTDVVAEPGDGQVTIRWKNPAHCVDVTVWRRSGRDGAVTDKGVRITASGGSVVDQRLKNGQAYTYQIVARFEDPRGGQAPINAPAASVEVVPVAAPFPVTDLRAEHTERTVTLHWTTPPSGSVQLRVSRDAPALPVGAVLNVKDLDRIGQPIPVSGPSSAQATLDQQGRVFYCPLTVVAQSAVLGDSVAVTALDDISDLTTRRQGKSIYLRWHWPRGANEVFITWRHDRFPRSHEEQVDGARRLTRAEYDRTGQFLISQAIEKRHYFRIFVKDTDYDFYSAGMKALEAGGLETQIRYRVSTTKSLFRRSVTEIWIELSTEVAVSEIPAVLAVLRDDLPPLSPDDGRIIARKPNVSFADGQGRIELPANATRGYVKLFFQNARNARQFRLMPAAKNNLRIA